MPWSVNLQEWLSTPRANSPESRSGSPNPVRTEPCRTKHTMEVAGEIAGPTATTSSSSSEEQYSLRVTRTLHLDSDIVAVLRPSTLVKPVMECVLPDGTRRMCVAALVDEPNSSPGGSLLGWLTAVHADGTPLLRRYARPIYDVMMASLKVRRTSDVGSKYVRSLACGTRIHLIDLTTLEDGTVRARVVVLNQPHISAEKTCGWITASKPHLGSPMIQELVEAKSGLLAPVSGMPNLRLCTPLYGTPAPPASPQQSPQNPTSPRALGRSAGSPSQWQIALTEDGRMDVATFKPSSPSSKVANEGFWVSSVNGEGPMRVRSSRPYTSKVGTRPRLARLKLTDSSSGGAKSPKSPKSSKGRTKTPPASMRGGSGGAAHSMKERPGAEQAAVAGGNPESAVGDPTIPKRFQLTKKERSEFKLLRAEDIEAGITQLLQAAEAAETQIAESGERALDVEVGEALQLKTLKVSQLPRPCPACNCQCFLASRPV